ncbi:hypothetical protein VNO77_46266 [Canavalia gladiata]|uniref:Uncharacterized protein n=1 Tax=Canavalia gladiata TaxID=3824 RepID=A0AAN9JKG2_CANGL
MLVLLVKSHNYSLVALSPSTSSLSDVSTRAIPALTSSKAIVEGTLKSFLVGFKLLKIFLSIRHIELQVFLHFESKNESLFSDVLLV